MMPVAISRVRRALSALLLLAIAFPCVADEPPEASSSLAHVFIAGAQDIEGGYNFETSPEDLDELWIACQRQGKVWIDAGAAPATCLGIRQSLAWARLRIQPAPAYPRQKVRFPPHILSLQPLIADLAPRKNGDMLELLIDAAGTTIRFEQGRQLLDTNEGTECATHEQHVSMMGAQGGRSLGRLPALPTRYFRTEAGQPPYAVVETDCGKQMGIWQLLPQVKEVVHYSNGYEYG
jgi:hypothetical protein